jgi:hypothetical protein
VRHQRAMPASPLWRQVHPPSRILMHPHHLPGVDFSRFCGWPQGIDRLGSITYSRSRIRTSENSPSSAPFLKYGKQRCASGTAVVWEDDPKPTGWLFGLAAE